MNNFDQGFKSVTVFVLASNETELLNETVLKIKENCPANDLESIVLVVKSRNCPSYSASENIVSQNPDGLVKLYVQKSSTLEECVAELPLLAQSSHFIIMVGDMENDPSDIKKLINKAKQHPQRIICASKWHKDSVIEGYGQFHEFGSRAMNLFISFLFNRNIKDPFSVYQIFPVAVYKKLNYSLSKSFVFEYTLIPLRTGIEYEEIPTAYKNRTSGKSNFNYLKLFQTAFLFCLTAIKIRFTPKNKLIRVRKR